MNTDILTTAEAADYLKTTPSRVKALAAAGKIPATKEIDGDEYRFIRDQLKAYLMECADIEQRTRQGEHRVIQVAKKDGALKRERGRPTKASVSEILERYGDTYGR